MKKSIITLMTILGITSASWTQPAYSAECQYTLLQNLIRDARTHEKVFEMIKAGVSMEDATITCGGSLLQLAIRRGNPSIVNGILTQDKERINDMVFLPELSQEKIPVILYGAYYAPSEIVFKVLLDSNANITVTDSKGRGILWYLDQNPVLRKTATEDIIRQKLQNLLLETARQNTQRQMGQANQLQLNEIKDNTPSQLATPTLSGSSLATP